VAAGFVWWSSRFTPDSKNVQGDWVAVKNTTLRFKSKPYSTRLTLQSDGTFTWTNVDQLVIGYGSYYEQQRSSLLLVTEGTWGVFGELMGPARVVHLSLSSLADRSVAIMVVGRGSVWNPRLEIRSVEGTIVFRKDG